MTGKECRCHVLIWVYTVCSSLSVCRQVKFGRHYSDDEFGSKGNAVNEMLACWFVSHGFESVWGRILLLQGILLQRVFFMLTPWHFSKIIIVLPSIGCCKAENIKLMNLVVLFNIKSVVCAISTLEACQYSTLRQNRMWYTVNWWSIKSKSFNLSPAEPWYVLPFKTCPEC